MSPEVLSIIGILLGLAILIVFALKGVPLYVLAPLAALVVAIFLAVPYWKANWAVKNRRRSVSAGVQPRDPAWNRRSNHA